MIIAEQKGRDALLWAFVGIRPRTCRGKIERIRPCVPAWGIDTQIWYALVVARRRLRRRSFKSKSVLWAGERYE